MCAGELGLERMNSNVSSQASVEDVPAVPEVSTKIPAIVPLPDDLTVMNLDCGAFHTGEIKLNYIEGISFNF